jgi:NADH-quinone oxidoreductase subunit C
VRVDIQQRAIDLVSSRFGAAFRGEGAFRDQRWVVVDRAVNGPVLQALRDELGFAFLMDLTCVDYLGWDAQGLPAPPERFCLVYQLYDHVANGYFRVKAWVPEGDAEAPSVHTLWKAVTWAEREIWDQYGIRFAGLPDHRRILNPMDYTGHPLRKDYPLVGRGERSNFPQYVK